MKKQLFKTLSKRSIITVSTLILVGLLLFAGEFFLKVSWSPVSVAETVVLNESAIIQASFTPTQDFWNLLVTMSTCFNETKHY